MRISAFAFVLIVASGAVPAEERTPFVWKDGDTVVRIGGTDVVLEGRYGFFEAYLRKALPGKKIRVRNLGWQGDTVFEQRRDLNFGDWKARLAKVDASVLVISFGRLESLDKLSSPKQFVDAYARFLDSVDDGKRRFVLLSPVRFEDGGPHRPSAESANRRLREYVDSIRSLAAKRGRTTFVDLFSLDPNVDATWGSTRLTIDGLQISESGYHVLGRRVATALSSTTSPRAEETLREAVIRKNRLWVRYWRPKNWAFLRGDRDHVAFSRDPKDPERRAFAEELERFRTLIDEADEEIRLLASGRSYERSSVDDPAEDSSSRRDDPVADLRAFEPLEGFEVSLFASERDGVANPIQLRWDTAGRLYVVTSTVYPQIAPGQEPDDKIIVLEDRDGDGRADRSTVFARDLDMPQGLELGHGGVWVGSGTDLLFLRDHDGDLRADERRVVLSGFGTGDSHQLINSFVWGPDGALYISQGLHIFSRIETAWGVERLDSAGLWRYRPRRGRLDGFFGRKVAPHNPWGLVFDDFGQPIWTAGNGHGIYWPVPAMIRTDHFIELPAIHRRFKHAGADLIDGRLFPENMHGQLITGGYKINSILRFTVDDSGTSPRVRLLEPLVKSKRKTFRPVDVKVGPDGAVWICDWHNTIVDHYGNSFRHPDRDKTHGRIWRVTPKGKARATSNPPIAKSSVTALLDTIETGNRWERNQSRREIETIDEKIVVPALRTWTKRFDETERTHSRYLIDALGLHEMLEIVDEGLLRRMLRSPDRRVRAYATRAIGHWHDRLSNPLSLLEARIRDDDARVRIEAIVAASYVPEAKSVEVVLRAFERPVSPEAKHAVTRAVRALERYWRPALTKGDLVVDPSSPGFELLTGGRRPKDDVKELWAIVLESSPPPAELESALRSLADVLRFDRKTSPPPRAIDALRKRLSQDDAGVRLAAAKLAGVLGLDDLAKDLETLSREDHRALRALADVDLVSAASIAREALREPRPESEIDRLLRAFLPQREGTKKLATALESSKLPADNAKLLLRSLRAIGRNDTELTTTLTRLVDERTHQPEFDEKLLASYVAKARSNGDARRGETIFRHPDLACARCHALGGAGGTLGPDLSAVGTGLSLEQIVESVVWPARQVKEGYQASVIVTKTGEVLHGYEVTGEKDRVLVRTVTDPKPRWLPRDSIAQSTQGATLMPDGLLSPLTEGETADLFAFLSQLGRPGAFRVPAAEFVRTWEVRDARTDRWKELYATVSGHLPVDELRQLAEEGSSLIDLRFGVESLRSRLDQLAFEANASARITSADNPVRLTSDKDQVRITIDLRKLPKAGLRCRVEPLTPSPPPRPPSGRSPKPKGS